MHTLTDAQGGRKQLEWDAQGNLAAWAWTDCSGQRSALHHDALGWLVLQTDALGNRIRTTLPDGRMPRAGYEWDAGHRLVQAVVTLRGVVQSTGYEYGTLGRRMRKTDAFEATEFLWDGDLMIESRRGARSELWHLPFAARPLSTVACVSHCCPTTRGDQQQ